MKKNVNLSNFLGELELSIMEIAWENEPVSVRDVLTALNRNKRKLAYTTVMTVMTRLKNKGWLTAHQDGRAYVYRPVYSREEAEATAVGKIVRGLIRDHGDVAIAQFLKEVDDIPPDQLAKLSALARQTQDDETGHE